MKKPKYVPPCRNLAGKLAFIAESGKAYYLDDFNKASDAKRAATIDGRLASEIVAALQANEENE